jgi:hypothetical protein
MLTRFKTFLCYHFHSGEYYDRDPSGLPILRCRKCHRTRPSILYATPS